MRKKKFTFSLALFGLLMASTTVFADAGPPQKLPDAGSSALLLGMAMTGLAVTRKFWRK